MSHSQFQLLKTKRFLPLFVTQFLGALNDNLFKNALVILILYQAASDGQGQILVTAAAGIFIVPFFLFSATAGRMADKYEKAIMIRRIKIAEILIMSLATLGFLLAPEYDSLKAYALLGVLALMGIQSAFFGPLKYAILPDHLETNELVGGNALVETATFLAILIGTIAGGLLILLDPFGASFPVGPFVISLNGAAIVSFCLLVVAVFGYLSSAFIPKAGPAAPEIAIGANFLAETYRVMRDSRDDRRIFLTILAISWFWLVGFTFLAQFPAYVKDTLGADEQVVTLFLTIFSVGIGIGSMLTSRLLKGEVTAKYVPMGALGISLSILALYYSSRNITPADPLLDALGFLQEPLSWLIVAELLAIAIFSGLYIVPLYAIMQHLSAESHRARVIAANNIMNALFMTVSAVATIVMLKLGVTVPQVFLVVAILNFAVALYICKLLPEALAKAFFRIIFRLAYRVEVKGLENYAKSRSRRVIIANHVSFIDGMLLATYLPEKPTFAIDTHMAQRWWAGPFLSLIDFYPMDPTKPLSTKGLIKVAKSGQPCVIFPEGRLTVTGALMKVYEGPGMIADKADADILPVRIDGAQFTPFSRMKGKLRLRWFPKITLTVLKPQRFEVDPDLRGRVRRRAIGNQLYDVMCDVIFRTCNVERTLYEALIDAEAINGKKATVFEDSERRPMSYRRLVLGTQVLGRRLAAFTEEGETVALLLPNAVGGAATFFALQAFGRVPAMLNFSAGQTAMEAACTAAGIEHIVTSRRFIQAAKLEPTLEAISQKRKVHYLEDISESMGVLDKLYGLIAAPRAESAHRRRCQRAGTTADSPAVVLFTSGSEGLPKAVVLSHKNLLSNAFQLASRIDFNPRDLVFNALPIFHSFGLSAGMILPAISGIKTFLYPSPLHYRIIPELVYDTNATILFGTDSFLTGYARVANPYDFYSVRYIFAGAEKVKAETHSTWMQNFGLRILEGYGATETSPVLSSNTPMHFKSGSVGRLLPGIEHRLEPVPGIDEGGRLFVKGPNVMLGYYFVNGPQQLVPPPDGWYDTGDIVELDERDFITIKGRAKRFAKIAGEMVSLSAVEDAASQLWPGVAHSVVALPDARKGEQLVLLTEQPDADRSQFLAHAQAHGLPELMVPRNIFAGSEIPLLGSGKVDMPAAKTLAEKLMGLDSNSETDQDPLPTAET